jgi:hypothetical protein
MAGLKFDITGDNSNMLAALQGTQNGVRQTARVVEQSGHGIEQMFSKIQAVASTALAGFGAQQFAQKVMQVRGQFQQLEIAFKTMLGSEDEANKLMDQLVKTAAKTPFDLQGIAQGAKQLLAYGIQADDVNETLVRLGDISAGLSIPLNDLVYLYGTTITQGRMFTMDLRQFLGRGIPMTEELAKQFGVTKEKVGELVTAGKVSAENMKQAIISMTSEGGKFASLMEKQSHTITGQISNIEDAVDTMFNEIGKKSEGVINTGLSSVSYLVENWEKIGKVVLEVAVAYGSYKAALLAVLVAHKVQAIYGAITAFLSLAKGVHAAKDAMLLFNLVSKANPIGLIVSVITSAAAAFYLFGENTDTAAKAQENMNKIAEKAAEKAAEEKTKIDLLVAAAKDDKLSMDERKEAIDKLNKRIPKYNAQLDVTTGRYKENKKALDAYIKSLAFKYELEGAKDKLAAIGRKKIEAQLKIDKAVIEQKKASIARKTLYNNSGAFIPTPIVGAKEVGDQTSKINEANKDLEAALTEEKLIYKRYGKALEQDTIKTTTTDSNKDEENRESETKKRAKEVKERAEEAERAAEQAASDRENKIKSQRAWDEQVANLHQDTLDAISDAKIAKIEDNGERERAEQKKQHEKNLQAIQEQSNEMKKAIYARNEEVWNQKNKDKKIKYTDTEAGKAGWQGVSLTKDGQDKINALTEIENTKYNRSVSKLEKEQEEAKLQALYDYLKEYGTFEEKKLAITKEYEEKTQKAKTIGEKASLEMQRNKDIEKLSNDEVYNTIDWDGVFSDLQGHTKEYLQGLRNQLQELLNTGNLPIDQMQVVSEKIQTIDSELGKQQGIWDFIGERTREHNRLVQEAADAQERLNVAKSKEVGANFKLNTIKSEVQNALSKAGLDLNLEDINTSSLNEKIDLTDEKFKSMGDVLQRLAVAEGKLIEARKKVTEATNKAKQSEDKSKRTSAQSFADWFSDAQEFIAKKGIDQIPDLLDSIGLGNSGVANFAKHGLDAFNSASGAAADFASGNYIGAVVKGVSAVKSFISAFSGGSNHEEKVAIQKEISKRIETLNTSINKLTDKIEKSYGIDALTVGQEALKLQTKNTQSAWNGLFAAGEDNYGKGHSDFYHWNKNTRYIAKSIAQDYSIGFVNSWQDLFSKLQHLQGNKGAEIMNDIRTNHADWWSIMQTQGYNDGAIGKWLDQIADSFDKVSNIVKKTKAQITGTTEDNVFSSFMDNLYSLADGTEDVFDNISKNWQKMINKMVINNVLGGKYRKAIADWYEEWFSAYNNNNNIDATEISNLKEKYNEIVKNASNEINLLKEQGLLRDDSSYKQTTSANSASSITYDQANVLTGLITAGNIDRVQMKDAVVNAIANITAIMSFSSLTSTTIVEIRNLMISNNSYLEDILKYTKQIFNGFTAQINDVNKNLKELK